MSFKRGILLIGLAVTFIPVSTVFAEDSADFVACQLIKPRGEFTPMKEKKNCFRDLAKETARQYNELLKQPSVHVAEPRERRSTGDRGEVAVDESGAALLTCPGETLLYIPKIIYAQEAISGNTQEIDVIDLCSPGIERWQLSDAICDYAELPIVTSDGAKFCFNSAIQARTEWCAQWGDTIDANKCWGTRPQYSALQEFLFDSEGNETAYKAHDVGSMCVTTVRMRGCFRKNNITLLCDENDLRITTADMNDNVEEVAEVCDLAAQCIDDVINTNPDIFQADGNNITTMSLNESYEFNRVQLVTDVVKDAFLEEKSTATRLSPGAAGLLGMICRSAADQPPW